MLQDFSDSFFFFLKDLSLSCQQIPYLTCRWRCTAWHPSPTALCEGSVLQDLKMRFFNLHILLKQLFFFPSFFLNTFSGVKLFSYGHWPFLWIYCKSCQCYLVHVRTSRRAHRYLLEQAVFQRLKIMCTC